MVDYILSHSVSTSQHNIVVAKEKAIQIKTPRFHSVLAVNAAKVSRAFASLYSHPLQRSQPLLARSALQPMNNLTSPITQHTASNQLQHRDSHQLQHEKKP
jgi:hypothetical protein